MGLENNKFAGKYRIATTRLEGWDYGAEGFYFITICCKPRLPFFGKLIGGEVQLSAIGKIAQEEWMKTFELRKGMNLQRGEFVVMPDHFHAIIGIGQNAYNSVGGEKQDGIYKNEFRSQSNNLASIVRGYKSAVTIGARRINPEFSWQSLYYDRIIRDEEAYAQVTRYIINNPKKGYKRNRM